MSVPSASLRRALRRVAKIAFRGRDRLAERAERAAIIAQAERGGHMVICSGGTDCDGYSSQSHTVIPATVTHFEAYRDRCGEDAEGRWHCYVVRDADADTWADAYDARDYAVDDMGALVPVAMVAQPCQLQQANAGPSLESVAASVPFAGAVHDFSRPMAERAKSRKMCGPYHWKPTPAGSGRGFYMEHGRRDLECARHGAGFRLRISQEGREFGFNEFGETIQAFVMRLPRGRGFMAGWTMGAGMCASLEPERYDDEDDAFRAANDAAQRAADRQAEDEAEQRDADEGENDCTDGEDFA